MDWVDWIEELMQAARKAWGAADPMAQMRGLGLSDISGALRMEAHPDPVDLLFDLRQLLRLGLLEEGLGQARYKLSQEGLKFPDASISSAWSPIFDIFLTDEQETLLRTCVAAAQETRQCGLPGLREVSQHELIGEGDAAHDDVIWLSSILRVLEEQAMVDRRKTIGPPAATPTYVGVVRATRRQETEEGKLLRELLADGESANVDFKRELPLNTPKQKSEFVRDCLGMANAQLRGQRFLVIGFSDEQELVGIHDALNPESLEQILHAWARPAPDIRVAQVAWGGRTAALIEVRRDAARLPYMATHEHSRLSPQAVYVRHGRHTTPASAEEESDIRAEGQRARAALL